MAKFMYLFRGGDAAMQQMSPEQKQAHMQEWGVWMKDLTKKGILVDGLPLSRDGKKGNSKRESGQ